MTPKWADTRVRKDKILAITIEHYVNSVNPVSSSYIAETSGLQLSSATIRNILAQLEEEGYLTHPHTSAGRIPTQKGYRYYVDYLMAEIHLLDEEKQKIKKEYVKESRELEALLQKTTQVLSDITHYTSIISVDGWDNRLFYNGTSFVVGYPDFQDIEKIRKILAALDEKERLLEVINKKMERKINILIGQEITCRDIDSCSLVVSSYKIGDDLSGKIAVLGPTRMHYDRVVSTLEYFSELMEGLK